jgi:2'-5' RNA ligase
VRLFVALDISATVREELASLLAKLRFVSAEMKDTAPRWVRAENLHVTLKFIGEAAPEKVVHIREALATVRQAGPLTLAFRGLGFFPDTRRPRVLWVGIEASSGLPALAAQIEGVLEGLGIPREERAFTPHLTLARFERPGLQERLRTAITQNVTREFGSYSTDEFHLIESKLKPSGAEYTKLQTFSFTAAEE